MWTTGGFSPCLRRCKRGIIRGRNLMKSPRSTAGSSSKLQNLADFEARIAGRPDRRHYLRRARSWAIPDDAICSAFRARRQLPEVPSASTRWWTPAARNSTRRRPISTPPTTTECECREFLRAAASRSSWCSAPAPSASARASSSTIPPSTACGRCKKLGYEVVIVNNNPETVSTDYDTADRLYFEPLTAEDVMNIIEVEKPVGVVVAFGGQTAIRADQTSWTERGMPILGTSAEGIDTAEDRERFDAAAGRIRHPPRPGGTGVLHHGGGAGRRRDRWAIRCCCAPRYVIGGQNMTIAHQPRRREAATWRASWPAASKTRCWWTST